jgi:hypothetical protein
MAPVTWRRHQAATQPRRSAPALAVRPRPGQNCRPAVPAQVHRPPGRRLRHLGRRLRRRRHPRGHQGNPRGAAGNRPRGRALGLPRPAGHPQHRLPTHVTIPLDAIADDRLRQRLARRRRNSPGVHQGQPLTPLHRGPKERRVLVDLVPRSGRAGQNCRLR